MGRGGGGRIQGNGETGNGKGTAAGEAGKSVEGKGDRGGGREKKERWWGPLRRNMGSTEEEVPIKFGTYNIRNGRNGGIGSALRGMAQANIDLGVFQETKCTNVLYTRASDGYCVIATDASRRHRGAVAIFYMAEANFAVEEVREYGPNVLSFKVVTGRRQWYIIGCYIAPPMTLGQ